MKKWMMMVMLMVIGLTNVNAQSYEESKTIWSENFVSVGDTTYIKSITPEGDVTMMVEINMPADKLYRFCKEWFATRYKNYKNDVQLEDKENGKLIVNCRYPLNFKGIFNDSPITMEGAHNCKIICDFKEGRFRVKANEYNAAYMVFMDKFPRTMQNNRSILRGNYIDMKKASGRPERYEIDYLMMLSGMIASMKEYIVKAANDDDF